MKKHRAKKKAIESKDKKEFRTRQDHEKIKAQREQWKLAKQKEREDHFSEKKKNQGKKKKASPKSTLSLEQDLASVESTSSSCNPIAYTTSALYKAVNSEDRASKKASKVCRSSLKGIDKEKEWNEELSSTIKETYKSMKGRRKCQVQTCYQS